MGNTAPSPSTFLKRAFFRVEGDLLTTTFCTSWYVRAVHDDERLLVEAEESAARVSLGSRARY